MSNLIAAPASDRPLIAYAFLAQTSYTDDDLLSALAPIFKPIAKTREGAVFDPNDFAKIVAKVFGIQVHPWVVEELAPRLERAALLKKVATSETTHQYALMQYRNGLVHGSASRPLTAGLPTAATPIPNIDELKRIAHGWALNVAKILVIELHAQLGTKPPPYLS